jgi:hypothetical protein
MGLFSSFAMISGKKHHQFIDFQFNFFFILRVHRICHASLEVRLPRILRSTVFKAAVAALISMRMSGQ